MLKNSEQNSQKFRLGYNEVFPSLCLGFLACVFFFPGEGLLAHRPNTQPGGPVYLSLSGCSPLTCPVRVAVPVATLPPA